MFIPLIIAGMIPLIMSPVWNFHLYQLEIDHQRRRIWLDNAAIRLGREDRVLFNQIEKIKRSQDKLHTAYHQALACGLNPKTALMCVELARKIRSLLQKMIREVEWMGQFRWTLNKKAALRLITEKGYRVLISRAEKIPLSKKRCPLCQESFLVHFDRGNNRTVMTAIGPPVLESVLFLEKRKEGSWDYRLQ